MKSKLWVLLTLSCVALTIATGCYRTVEGRSKATWRPWSKDTIEGRYERPLAQVFTAARKVLEFNGALTSENTIHKSYEAKIDTRSVWVKVDEIEPNLSRVLVQARSKAGTPDLDLAAEIEKQIALQLAKQ
jgi:hypothetical protein